MATSRTRTGELRAPARKLDREGDDADELMRASTLKAREIASGYPRLGARLEAASAEYGAAPEHTFEFGLQAILDGLGAGLAAGIRPAATGPAVGER
jgi:hypothetical protein